MLRHMKIVNQVVAFLHELLTELRRLVLFMALRNTSSSYRKDIDDGAIGKPEMLKDFTEERNGVEKGCLVLSQDCFFSCNNRIECLQSLMDWAYV